MLSAVYFVSVDHSDCLRLRQKNTLPRMTGIGYPQIVAAMKSTRGSDSVPGASNKNMLKKQANGHMGSVATVKPFTKVSNDFISSPHEQE